MTADVDWEISNLYPGINCLALCFVSCRFAWFKREASSTGKIISKFFMRFNSMELVFSKDEFQPNFFFFNNDERVRTRVTGI